MNNFFLSHRNPILAVLIVLLAGGIFSYSKMQSSLFPEVTFPKIKIIAENGLQPVSKMMISVTKPLENTIKHVPDLINIRSITSRGSCEISAFLNWNADIDLSKQQIESAINQVKNDLPSGCEVVIEKMNPSILPVIGFIIEGKNKNNIELNQIAINLVKPFLIQENGVSDVRVVGGKNKEYKVELMPQKMSSLGITPSDVTTALQQTNFIKSNGYLTDYNRLYLTITDVSIKNIDDFQNLVIKNDGKRILRLQDIANIKISEETQFIRVNANGENAVLVTILKQPNANLIDLTKGIKSRVDELNNTILPKGITLKPYYTQADFVESSIESVNTSIWIGLFLAIVVAIIFLRSIKSSAVILITIPITLSFTYIIMKMLNFNFNIMTLGAIAASIGLIIDDAIVVVEQIHRTHEEHPETPTRELLSRSINFLFPAMIGSSLSTIVIFFPFVLLSGVAGAYFSILTDTMMIVLVCSFFVTWIGLPVIYLIFSSDVNTVKARPVQNIHKQGRWISYFITRPALSYLFIAFLLCLLFIIPGRLESGFLPDMDEGSIVMDYKSPPEHLFRKQTACCVRQKRLSIQSRKLKAIPGEPEPKWGSLLPNPMWEII
jgi:multidrug efflux pump subunit AcrB